jgi:hypothetical protein
MSDTAQDALKAQGEIVRKSYENKIARLERELAAAQADAERYRWLREQHWNQGEMCVVTNPRVSIKLGYDCPSLNRLDAAIDAAMKECGK